MPDNLDDLKANRIARMIFRNDEVSLVHTREVIQLEEYLGSIAGMFDLIMYFILIFFGSYINFMSRVKWIKSLYKFKDCNLNSKIDQIDPQSQGD